MSKQESGREKILIVDDEPAITKYLEALLQDNGYDTLTAADGNEAMEKTRNYHPDLISLDITMPEKSGVRFYKELREDEQLKDIPVVVVTAVTGYGGDPNSFREFLDNRPQFPAPEDFVSKPIEREAFLETIEKVLAAKAS